jgi:hypothetical protein
MVSLAKNLKYQQLIFIEYWIETAPMSIGANFFACDATIKFYILSDKRFFIGYWINYGLDFYPGPFFCPVCSSVAFIFFSIVLLISYS